MRGPLAQATGAVVDVGLPRIAHQLCGSPSGPPTRLWFDWHVAAQEENPNVDLVNRFLRAQNLEQVTRVDEAVELYESMLEAGFDSIGPYDRLIEIYSNRAAHREVVRVAGAALTAVHTYPEKRAWYEQMLAAAEKAAAAVPQAAPKRAGGAREA